MSIVKKICALGLMAALSACATTDTATRGGVGIEAGPAFVSNETNAVVEAAIQEATSPVVRIVDFKVDVPSSLRVSEANLYYPMGDIVWRGDPLGNRYDQVRAIFQDSLRLSSSKLTGDIPVAVEVTVARFHSLTEKTRYTIGGVHSITFDLTIRHAVSGDVLLNSKRVKADLKGYGGVRAIEAESRGLTQKYRITQHLARVFQQELTPDAVRTSVTAGQAQKQPNAL